MISVEKTSYDKLRRNDVKDFIGVSFGRYIKTHFGKGPDKVKVIIEGSTIMVELYGLLNRAEREVIRLNEVEKAIKKHRSLILEALCQKIDPIEEWLGIPVEEIFFNFIPCEDKCYLVIETKNKMKSNGSIAIQKNEGRDMYV
ncbi:Na-translocating system protein MpsC family protein [Phosphitispora fastidiosa]|uniref:Na-translocating system protein MpsC family protein n=1 Tax=Phosphitispora fastidiosa TaxID=2837202 RepID=UPI001E62F824|nr:Na-translocating system protein MpsC family protein [Phosphitispora fastidiosa]MBU7005657.1 putative protein YbcI [Phosphitispora fastidiosa]